MSRPPAWRWGDPDTGDLYTIERARHGVFAAAREAGFYASTEAPWVVFCPSCETRVIHSVRSHLAVHEALGPAVGQERWRTGWAP